MTVRPIRAGDLDVWCRMRSALWPAAAPRELIREAEASFDGASALRAVFLAEAPSGQPRGMLELSLGSYAEGCLAAPVPYIESWYVVPEARRRGVGRGLVAAAESWARERRYTELASDAVIDDLGAERAHRALGFDEVERATHFRKVLERARPGSTMPSSATRSR